jgi:flagellar motility protein MotE (MotC chaperone)
VKPRIVLKYARLLPAVMVASAVLLALKIAGVADIARAQTGGATPTVQQTTTPVVTHGGGADDAESSSSAEVDVLTSLAKRRTELDARSADLDMRENLIAAAEKRVDAKIATLKDLQTQLATLMGQHDTEAAKQIANLVKVYSDMKPRDAAQIFNTLSEDVLVPVANGMKPDALAPVMAQMQPEAAQRLTVRLANRLKLPATAAAASATLPATTPAPQAANTTPVTPSAAPAASAPGG